jgi:hypothetical protein
MGFTCDLAKLKLKSETRLFGIYFLDCYAFMINSPSRSRRSVSGIIVSGEYWSKIDRIDIPAFVNCRNIELGITQ